MGLSGEKEGRGQRDTKLGKGRQSVVFAYRDLGGGRPGFRPRGLKKGNSDRSHMNISWKKRGDKGMSGRGAFCAPGVAKGGAF